MVFRLTVCPTRAEMDMPRERRAPLNGTSANSTVTELIHSLPTLPKDQLCALWLENFGRPAVRVRPELMLPILAFRIQERAYGGLSAATKERLRETLDSLAPKNRAQNEARRRFKPGTRLVREWKGETHEVTLTAGGYDYRGKRYKTLSPIACQITGTRWSGPAFFGTKKMETKG
ncbi:MAG: hypothetical protein JWQ42_2763 [Edaphobacter sp.]|nr:hypothetical protein [Edaphobacter sp.]